MTVMALGVLQPFNCVNGQYWPCVAYQDTLSPNLKQLPQRLALRQKRAPAKVGAGEWLSL